MNRGAGAADQGAEDPFHHVVQFYEEDARSCGALADFLMDGHRAGEPMVLVATRSRWQAITPLLESRGFDFGEACERGEAAYADAQAVLDHILVDGEVDEARFTDLMRDLFAQVSDGRPDTRIRVFGQLVDLLARAGRHDTAMALEDLWSDLARTRDFSLFCAYHRGNLYREVNGSAYREVCGRHSHVAPAEG